jgi:hypothetical protein
MTTLRATRILAEANRTADELVRTARQGEHAKARELAASLYKIGVGSLSALAPRGTLKFAAPVRLHGGEGTIGELVSLLRSGEIPREEWPGYFDALGTWAGEEAVQVIGELLSGLSLGRGWEENAGAPLQHGFRALHLIGGPEAAELLREFQKSRKPGPVREQASWYLNQLSHPSADLMYGVEVPEPASADGVKVRDSLWDPYRWGSALHGLSSEPFHLAWHHSLHGWEQLIRRIPSGDLRRISSPEPFPLSRALASEYERLSEEHAECLEALIQALMIRLSETRLLVWLETASLFVDPDVEERHHVPPHRVPFWELVQLRASSDSARYLDRLALMRVPKGDEVWDAARAGDTRSPNFQGAVRSWLISLPGIAQQFNRRKAPWLSFLLACAFDFVHKEKGWPCPPLAKTLPTWLGLPPTVASGHEALTPPGPIAPEMKKPDEGES